MTCLSAVPCISLYANALVSLGQLGVYWKLLGTSWRRLGGILGHLGCILGHLGSILGHLGGILKHLRSSWRHLGGIFGRKLGQVGAKLGASWARWSKIAVKEPQDGRKWRSGRHLGPELTKRTLVFGRGGLDPNSGWN